MFFKNEKEKCFAYLSHTACDKNNFILDFHITPGNVHDSVAFSDLYKKLKQDIKHPISAIAIDAGYITPYICKTLLDDNIIPAIPYKRPMTKQGYFKKYEYVYDEFYDCYLCPNNKILKYLTTNRDGYREYKSNAYDCKNCIYVKKCTNSKTNQKILTRHIWQDYIEEANHLRYKTEVKKIYQKRKETIERVFADAKEKHGMRYTKLRGLQKIKMEVSLIFSCMNLKKLANWLWRDTFGLVRRTPISRNFYIFYLYIIKMVPFTLVIGTICLQTEKLPIGSFDIFSQRIYLLLKGHLLILLNHPLERFQVFHQSSLCEIDYVRQKLFDRFLLSLQVLLFYLLQFFFFLHNLFL